MVRLGWEHLEQIVFRDWGCQEKQTIRDVSALCAYARVCAWKSSVTEFPCSLGCSELEFTVCYLDVLF